MKSKYLAFLFLLVTAVSCEPKLDEFSPSAGSADFTTYVALGNSLTAGYSNGALYTSGQSYSYANLIAQQMKLAGGGEFVMPVVENEDGLLAGKLQLGISTNCLGVSSLGPISAGGTPTGIPAALAPIGYAVNNFGVPGAKSYHLIAPGYGNPLGVPASANPYFVRFASSTTTTVLADAAAKDASFFSLWIGNNDVLGYSTSGGLGDVITDQATFTYAINTILTTMTANGAKGLVANIPDVTSVPFFNTVPYNGLEFKIEDSTKVKNLNQYHLAIGSGIVFNIGKNPFVISDPTAANGKGMRQLVAGELVLLTVPQDSIRCAFWGSLTPIPGQFTLVASEIDAVQTATTGFNQTLKSLAEANGLAYVDVNSFMSGAKTGLVYDGIKFSVTYVTGGVFSLDGVHLTARGNAIIANLFIEAINAKYGASVPQVNIGDYPGLLFP